MTDTQDKADWELEIEKALETGEAGAITNDLIKLGLAKQAFHGDTPGARATNLKSLAQVNSMLIQVVKDDRDDITDDQLAMVCAEQFHNVSQWLDTVISKEDALTATRKMMGLPPLSTGQKEKLGK